MKIHIKYMVSLRCKLIVKEELGKLGVLYSNLELGSVELQDQLSDAELLLLRKNLLHFGLELMDDNKGITISPSTPR